jgi:hypothetical protein
MNTKKLAGIIVACTVAITLVIVIVILPLMSPPTITKLVDQTLVVPVGVENAPRVYFDVPRTGILKGTVEVITGQEISYYLYPEPSEPGWTVAKGESVLRSDFEVPLDTGRYELIIVAYLPNQDDPNEERIVNVYLEFEN